MKKYSVGIIGNGRFGNLLSKTLLGSDHFIVKLFSRHETPDNKIFFTLREVSKCDICYSGGSYFSV